ncbi:MAG: arylsulfatase A-like enzyme, partial [Pseudoalteromonas tetraodonis]
TPHNPERMAKDTMEFPQFDESYAKGHSAIVDWPWKLHRINADRYELYNLETDPRESEDLSEKPEQAERLKVMRSKLGDWMKSVVRSVNGADYDGVNRKPD